MIMVSSNLFIECVGGGSSCLPEQLRGLDRVEGFVERACTHNSPGVQAVRALWLNRGTAYSSRSRVIILQ